MASRDVLVEGSPEAADGQVLQLVRYDIPAGVVLPMHTHPGMQIAWIESGVLTYHVVSGGSIPVTRAAHDGTPESTELLGPGRDHRTASGRFGIEVDGVVHYGENLGPEPVVILAATLLDPDEPASVVWTPVSSRRWHSTRRPEAERSHPLVDHSTLDPTLQRASNAWRSWPRRGSVACRASSRSNLPLAADPHPSFGSAWARNRAILRLSETPDASLGPEALAHEVLLSYGARVPAVIGYEPFDPVLGRSVMLTTAIPGSSLDDAMPSDPDSGVVRRRRGSRPHQSGSR